MVLPLPPGPKPASSIMISLKRRLRMRAISLSSTSSVTSGMPFVRARLRDRLRELSRGVMIVCVAVWTLSMPVPVDMSDALCRPLEGSSSIGIMSDLPRAPGPSDEGGE